MKEISIHTEYITLGQFLKLCGAIDTGGQAKVFLAEKKVNINGQPEQRRGRKLAADDVIEIESVGEFRVVRV